MASLFAAAVALASLSACGDKADSLDGTPSHGPTVPAGAGQQLATGRVLAALAVQHLEADQARTLEGFGGPNGASSIIELRSGPGDRLYVQTTSPKFAPSIPSCAHAQRKVARGYVLISCETTPDGVIELISSPPGKDHAVIGQRIDPAGMVGAWVERSYDDEVARALVLDILRDPQLGYRVDPSTVNAAAELAGYKDIEVTAELR